MNVRHVQTHWTPLGDLPSFVKVALRALGASVLALKKSKPGTGEEGVGNHMLGAGAAQTDRGGLDVGWKSLNFGSFQNRRVVRGATQSKVIESNGEERKVSLLSPLDCL